VLAVRLSGFYWRRDGYVKANAELSSEAQGNLRNPALLAAIFGAGSTYDGQNVVVGSRTVVRNNVIIGGRDGQPFQSIAINNRDVTELRGIVSFTPTPSLTSTTLVTFHQDGNLGGANQGLYLLRNGLGVGTGTFAGPSSNPYDAFLSTDPRKPDSKAWAIINTTTFELSDSLTLKNIFGFIHATGYGVDGNDVDGGPSRTIDTYTSLKADRTNQYTNEFQVQGSTLNDRLQFTVGGLMDLLREPQSYSALNSSSSSGSATGIPDPNRPNANGALIRFLSTNVDSYALFGSFNLKLTDELTLSAGYRHTWDKLKGTQAGTQYDSLLGTGTPLDANPDQPGLQLTRTLNNKFQLNVYNATIDYKIGQDMRVYAGYRHGEKRGAFNSSAFGPFAASFNPEKIDSFSLGFKSQFRTGLGRVTFNVEGFYDKYKDYQASYLLLDAGRPGATFNLLTLTTNIPKVRYAGFDADFRLAMTAGIDLDLSYSYLDAKIISFPDPTVTPTNGLVDPGLTSNRIVAAPKNSLQAAIRFHGDSDWGRWALRPSVSYRSKYYFTTFNRVLPAGQAAIFGQFDNIPFGGGAVPATTLVDARAELNDIGGSQASFALGATNLLNKAYISGVTGTLLFGAEGRAYGPPRMVYGELSYRF
jgi:iron complex outermembrane receptor protein